MQTIELPWHRMLFSLFFRDKWISYKQHNSNSKLLIFIFDLWWKQSFENAITNHAHEPKRMPDSTVPCILVGLKSDLRHVIIIINIWLFVIIIVIYSFDSEKDKDLLARLAESKKKCVTPEQAKKAARDLGFHSYMECSAKCNVCLIIIITLSSLLILIIAIRLDLMNFLELRLNLHQFHERRPHKKETNVL